MFTERDIDITEFVKITNTGLKVADYNQIINTLSLRFREAYGSNIDLTMTTADGIFLHNTALIINNILQTMYAMYKNLNVNSSSGNYLDILCKLSNVERKEATSSKTTLEIYSSNEQELQSGAIFIDSSGTEWIYSGDNLEISTDSTNPTTITVECTEVGPISAPKESISQTLNVSDIVVYQPNDAIIGFARETDSELRARRAQSTGLTGLTVLQSLQGALLSLGNVKDVYIYNNVEDGSIEVEMNDGTTLKGHSIYVVLRGSDLDNYKKEIGETIFQKLTPGINTNETTDSTYGESGEYNIEIESSLGINQTIYWKVAKPIHPTCSITIRKNSTYLDSTNEIIAKAVINYLNNIRLSNEPDSSQMIISATYSDPTFKGVPTFVVINATTPVTENPNTYYEYAIEDVEYDDGDIDSAVSANPGEVIITFK